MGKESLTSKALRLWGSSRFLPSCTPSSEFQGALSSSGPWCVSQEEGDGEWGGGDYSCLGGLQCFRGFIFKKQREIGNTDFSLQWEGRNTRVRTFLEVMSRMSEWKNSNAPEESSSPNPHCSREEVEAQRGRRFSRMHRARDWQSQICWFSVLSRPVLPSEQGWESRTG